MPPQSKLRFSFVRVDTWEAALDLLDVRNACRDGMTHNTGLLTVRDQSHFWKDHLSPFSGDGKYEAYLLLDESTVVGFGMLKWDDEKEAYWMTAGVSPEYRGRNLSRFLIAYITEMGHREGHDVYIDVWEDNLALIGDIKVGYEVIDQKIVDGRVLNVMKHNRERVLRMGEAMLLRNFDSQTFSSYIQPKTSIVQELEEVDQIARESYQ